MVGRYIIKQLSSRFYELTMTAATKETGCNSYCVAFYKINKAIFMVAIFGAKRPRISGVYFRLKQFILDIYNGRIALGLQCRSVVGNKNNKKYEM